MSPWFGLSTTSPLVVIGPDSYRSRTVALLEPLPRDLMDGLLPLKDPVWWTSLGPPVCLRASPHLIHDSGPRCDHREESAGPRRSSRTARRFRSQGPPMRFRLSVPCGRMGLER